MTAVNRVLDAQPVTDLQHYMSLGGGTGLRNSIAAEPGAILDQIAAAGLRGRGGAGFPTAVKWQTITTRSSPEYPAAVVVNAAEGEPGTFKDRAILRANPYRVLEGALIAAAHLGCSEVKVAMKASAQEEVRRVTRAAQEVIDSGLLPGVSIEVIPGPDSYLFGEETALLEVIRGRPPFPRIAPPWRRGLDDGSSRASAAGADLATVEGQDDSEAEPALVNNVETFAQVALIATHGPEWFREMGTEDSPGTLVCTVTGRTTNSGVVEVAMGTPLREVLEHLDARPLAGEVVAVLPGVSNRLIPGDQLDIPLTYEHVAALGSGLGTGGFIILDEGVDPVEVAEGVARFLAVESCGQCSPCKQDGLTVHAALNGLRTMADEGSRTEHIDLLDSALVHIDTGARCFLATQHQQVVDSFRTLFPSAFGKEWNPPPPVGEDHVSVVITPLRDMATDSSGEAVEFDLRQLDKQPDWTYDAEDSGKTPVDRLGAVPGA